MSSPRSISTRTGDDGTTGLLYGQRVPKDHPQMEAIGALDEFNAALGLARCACPDSDRQGELAHIQRDLVALMGEIASAEADAARYAASRFTKVEAADLERLDQAVAALEKRLPPAEGWATPGANALAAALDLGRTFARRAERRLIALPGHGKSVRPLLLQYLNAVSDLLWHQAPEAETKA